jgi:hypothetical protein
MIAVRRLLFGVLTAGMIVTPAAAHHSVSGQFDQSKPMELTGTISKIDWINPHIYIHLDVKDAKGKVTTWALATLPTAMMRRSRITKESLQGKPGEIVKVDAVPARDGTKTLGGSTASTYADGHFLQLAGQ